MTEPIALQHLARIVDGQLLSPPLHPTYATDYSLDTRTLRERDVFVAISGRHFNGNDFVEKAFIKGACCAIVSRTRWQRRSSRDDSAELLPGPLIAVGDTTRALAKIALYWRRKLKAKVIAVTGSVGKTAAREFIYHVLTKAGSVERTVGNYNNIYGLPLSILHVKRECDYLVLELGMNAPGEITELAAIAEPDLGVVLNVEPCHTEFFESLDKVADAKAELIKALHPHGALFINADDDRLAERARQAECEVIGFGMSKGDYIAKNLVVLGENGVAFDSVHDDRSFSLRSPLLGTHNVYNTLAAIAIGRHVGLSWEAIAEGLLETTPLPHRLNLIDARDGQLKILDDTYNSSPTAVKAAIDTIFAIRRGTDSREPVVLILADMLELGEMAEAEHYKIGVEVGARGADMLLALGPLSAHTAQGARDAGMAQDRIRHFESRDEVLTALSSIPDRAWVLVKGSRKWALENLIEKICAPESQQTGLRDAGQ